MAGRMGSDRVSVKSLVVIDIDEKNNLVAIKGSVPGKTGGLVYIRKTGEGGVQVEKVESFDSAQDKQVLQVEPDSAPDVAEAMTGEKALTGKQVEQVETSEKVEQVLQVEQVEKEEIKGQEIPPSREATEG